MTVRLPAVSAGTSVSLLLTKMQINRLAAAARVHKEAELHLSKVQIESIKEDCGFLPALLRALRDGSQPTEDAGPGRRTDKLF